MINMHDNEINYNDITDVWIKETSSGSFLVCDGVMIGNKAYMVGENGVYVHDKLRANDVEIAKCLCVKYRKQVTMLPEISGYNKNVRMADLIVNGKLVEIKTIHASGPNTVKNAIKRAKGQANDIIINVGDTLLTTNEIIESIQIQFNNMQCNHMDTCIVMKCCKVIKVVKRKKIGTSAMLKHDVVPIINNNII